MCRPCLVAPEGSGGRPRDLERGAATSTPALQEQILGLIASGIEAHVIDRRRHLRAPGRADCRRGPRPAAGSGAASSSTTGGIGCRSRCCAKAVVPRRGALLEPTRADRACARRSATGGAARVAHVQTRLAISAMPRIRHRAAPARAAPPGALGQRAGQPALRHRCCPKRAAPTPGARTRTSCASRRGTRRPVSDLGGEVILPAQTKRPAMSGHDLRCRHRRTSATSATPAPTPS